MTNFQALGEELLGRVESRARQENYSNEAINSIAREELQALECDLVYDPESWVDFIQSTTIPQGRHWFSDIPLVLARNRNFQVQLLCWMTATTDIHAHAFCGAFRVLQGSSLHTSFRFEAKRWISDTMLLGRLQGMGSEYLQRGCVREIMPGRNGLVHSLFHLDSPSLTLLIRTHTSVAAKPQFAFYPPGLALDDPGLEQDEEVCHLGRLLANVARKDPAALETLLLKTLSRLDAPRLTKLCLIFSAHFTSSESRQRLSDLVTRHHDEELARCLNRVLSGLQFQRDIKAAREAFDDPELRFFLALLLNVRDRATLFELVQSRFPQRDPASACAEWLLGLARARTNAAAFMREVAARAEGGGYRLGSRIANRIPAEDDLSVVKAWLLEILEANGSGAAPNPLLDLPELAPLFRHRI